MGKLNCILPVLFAGCLLASRGSAADAAVKAPAPVKKDTKDTPVFRPLRYEGKNADEFLRTAIRTLAISTRELDPFGRPQNPEIKPAAPQPGTPVAEETPRVPFQDIVNLIRINTVIAGERKFLVGARSISQGDRFPIHYEGKPVWVEVTEVSARQVAFRNAETGETAAIHLNLLPPGMTPGNPSGAPAPGMTPAGAQAPLDLGTPAPVPSR